MKNLIRLLSVLALLLLAVGMVWAEDETEEAPIPTVETIVIDAPVVEAPVVVEQPAVDAFFIDGNTMLIVGSILLALTVGGAVMVALTAIDALKLSVPRETAEAIGTQIVNVITSAMATVKDKVEATPSPIDDVFYNAGKIGTDFLIEEIRRRSLNGEQQQAVAALGQGYGKNEIGSIG